MSLAPPPVLEEECPVVGGGGYLGFEHHLYRIEVADGDPLAPARFKWSPWNGGLVGRGVFDTTLVPARVVIDAGHSAGRRLRDYAHFDDADDPRNEGLLELPLPARTRRQPTCQQARCCGWAVQRRGRARM